MTITNPMTPAAKEATSAIPIVMIVMIVMGVMGVMGVSAEPVGEGLNRARPGGNITGFSVNTGHDIVAKRIQLLK